MNGNAAPTLTDISRLVMPEVNSVATALESYLHETREGDEKNLCAALHQCAPMFFLETCVKVNRHGDFFIKLTFKNYRVNEAGAAAQEERDALTAQRVRDALGSPGDAWRPQELAESTLFHYWLRSKAPRQLCEHMQASFPTLRAIVAHVRIPTSSERENATASVAAAAIELKPDKSCAYVPLTANKQATVTEYTPNGVPFVLSADSFCEVNHAMEDAIYSSICEFLHLPCQGGTGTGVEKVAHAESCRRAGAAFICGRDVNSVYKTFEHFYMATSVITTCPCVFSDSRLNGIDHCKISSKDQIAPHIDAFAVAHSGADRLHALVTAGRHGLHPTTTQALVRAARTGGMHDLIYVSCNVESMSRDAYLLKEAFYVAHCRTFDFFPGTAYVMTVLHWKPLPVSGKHGLLVLPVGPPGVGKSTCGKALLSLFEKTRQLQENAAERESSKKRARNGQLTLKPFVPRQFQDVPSSIDVRHVERDALFAAFHNQLSLKHTKMETHAALLAALEPASTGNNDAGGRRVVYMDSTNGSAEARDLYRNRWNACAEGNMSGTAPCAALSACLVLFFTPPNAAVLMQRVRGRQGHPSFPTDATDQERKMSVIMTALGEKVTENHEATSKFSSVHIHASSCEEGDVATIVEVCCTVCAHLYLGHELAILYGNLATPIVAKMLQSSRT